MRTQLLVHLLGSHDDILFASAMRFDDDVPQMIGTGDNFPAVLEHEAVIIASRPLIVDIRNLARRAIAANYIIINS